MKKIKRKLITLGVAAICFALYLIFPDSFSFMVKPESHAAHMAFQQTKKQLETENATIEKAFKTKTSGINVRGTGVIMRIIADGNGSCSTQRFTVNIPSGQNVEVSHGASPGHPTIRLLQEGAEIEFSGTYEWNAAGGKITNTVFNPKSPGTSGWIRYYETLYQ